MRKEITMRLSQGQTMGFMVAISLLVFLLGCTETKNRQVAQGAGQPQLEVGSNKNAVADNRSQIMATVVEVLPLDDSRFRIHLRIESVEPVEGYQSFAETGEVIDAYPNFIRREDPGVDSELNKNLHLLQAGNLKPGDRIEAKVYYRGPENSWLLMDWNRL